MSDKTKAHVRYKNKEGIPVPGVTTITGLLDKSGPLIHWAWKLGVSGQDYRKVRDKAADAGTLTHYLIECDSKEVETDKEYLKDFTQDNIDKAETGFLGYLEWKKDNIASIVGSELQLVDNDLGYGGTIDCTALDKNGKLALIDYKTGGVYETSYIQVSAYKNLCKDKIERVLILQIDKDTGSFIVHELGNLDNHFEIFKHLLAVYYLKKKIKKT